MHQWTDADGNIWVETRREGLLAAVGHDLLLVVTRFSVTLSPSRDHIEASVEAGSLKLQAALDGNREVPGAIGARDQGRIERTLSDEVLDVRRHPDIHFESTSVTDTAAGHSVTGLLSLRGLRRPVTLDVVHTAGRWRAQCTIHLSDFGIRPVTALLGALKVRDAVQVIVDLPDTDTAGGS